MLDKRAAALHGIVDALNDVPLAAANGCLQLIAEAPGPVLEGSVVSKPMTFLPGMLPRPSVLVRQFVDAITFTQRLQRLLVAFVSPNN